ncbi:MAG: ParB/RepB/Spo0J family partition protein [Alphaproteobacteria bacterium]|nr:ParB/RepB/Spo0J family partition protein [Alphaproteobacteria bacterium]
MTVEAKPELEKPAAKPKARGLGRGLNALFEDEEVSFVTPAAPAVKEDAVSPSGRARSMAGVDEIYPNPVQPRTHFDEEGLQQLADSMKLHGVLQPILVRERKSGHGKYEIIAGERRWRAAQKAQLHEVPVNIIELDDKETLQVALVENLQRRDLNPIEEAAGYNRLMKTYSMTQEDIAKVVGKSRPHIANMTRLLNLPAKVQEYIERGEISAGHARALITTFKPEELADEIIRGRLNVREAEELAAGQPMGGKKSLARKTVQKDADTVALERQLSDVLGMKTTLEMKNGKQGALRIDFKSLDQLDDLIHRLSQAPKVMLGE